VEPRVPSRRESTWLPSEVNDRIVVLQGTLDLIVLRTLQTMGEQHAYAIATRLQQVSEDLLHLNQGTLYPALVRLEQQGKIKGTWGKTESNREAKFYSITKRGEKALLEETERWRRVAGLVDKLLSESL
jgi:PadR family transcriptional regulator, regulatory protein PadR